MPRAERNRCPVHLSDPLQEAPAGIHHRPPQLPEHQPRGPVAAGPQLPLQLQGGNAIGVRRHHVRGQQSGLQWEMIVVHHRAGGRGGLPGAGAVVRETFLELVSRDRAVVFHWLGMEGT